MRRYRLNYGRGRRATAPRLSDLKPLWIYHHAWVGGDRPLVETQARRGAAWAPLRPAVGYAGERVDPREARPEVDLRREVGAARPQRVALASQPLDVASASRRPSHRPSPGGGRAPSRSRSWPASRPTAKSMSTSVAV